MEFGGILLSDDWIEILRNSIPISFILNTWPGGREDMINYS